MSSLVVSKATPGDLPRLEPLLRSFAFKNFQQKAQGLDAGKLVPFYLQGMEASLKDESTACWVVSAGEEALGFASLSDNAWHSSFYGCPMGRCGNFLCHAAPARVTPLLAEAVIAESNRRGYDMISLRIDGNEFEALHGLEAAGFGLIDVSVKMGAKICAASSAAPEGFRVRPYEAADREAVVRISGEGHVFNHFFNDERLDRASTRALFRAWVEKCIDSLAKHVFVIERNAGDVAGFVTYLLSGRFNQALGVRLVVLDYIVLDPSMQGRGLGPYLMEESLGQLSGLYDQVELRTSHNNYPALSLYSRYGFRILSTDFQLHRWKYPPDAVDDVFFINCPDR